VEESVKPKLLQLIKKSWKKSTIQTVPNISPVSSTKEISTVFLRLSIKSKCYGGNTNEETLYIEPTILDNVNWDDAVMQEEIFGPVFPVIGYTNYDEILEDH
jgi:aldehyde dehydrogenase (NAD+)